MEAVAGGLCGLALALVLRQALLRLLVDPIALPTLGPLSIKVQPSGITSVDDDTFLAVFGDVEISTAAPPAAASAVTTGARIVEVRAPRDTAVVKPASENETL